MAEKKMLQVKLEPAVIHTIKTVALHNNVAPGEIIELAIKDIHQTKYRSMVRRLKEGA